LSEEDEEEEEEEEEEDAGAAGAGDVEVDEDAVEPEAVEVAAALSPDPGAGVAAALSPPSFLASFFAEPYRSEPQPPPLRTKEVRLITFSSVPWAPQAGHDSGAGSLSFWRTSESLPHCLQTYS
jgi:hypothetical protein